MIYKLNAIVMTNAGKIRPNNEDNFYLFGEYKEDTNVSSLTIKQESTTENEVAAVFDGMGGEEAGEVASLLAASGMASLLKGNLQDEITSQVLRLNDRICLEMKRRAAGRMGTTFAGIYFDCDKAISANIGDSRTYLLRDGKMYQLSHDHSEAQSLIDQGMMTEKEARVSKKWHVITQCLGVFPDEFVIMPYFSKLVELKANDRFLVCSDGLTDLIYDEDIEYLLSVQDNEEAAKGLLEAALKNGGSDNVTIMIVDVI